MSLSIPFSQACERNKDPIFSVLGEYFRQAESVLEIGTGTGQHLIYFADKTPNTQWQPTDQACYLDGITAQLAANPRDNCTSPSELDVTQDKWFEEARTFDLVYTANTLHIMPWSAVKELFQGLEQVSKPNTKLCVYGPFKFDNQHTSASNLAFDADLKARGCGSGIRNFEDVNELASQARFSLIEKHAMPANNFCLVWSKLD